MPKGDMIDASDDARTGNTLRHKYRVLTDAEKQLMDIIRDKGEALLGAVDAAAVRSGSEREYAIARTKIEEAVMWAIKGLTK